MVVGNGLKVISGGQTGVDRAALDAAMELGLAVGGFCPKGRKAEDGRIPSIYPLVELKTSSYLVRTERNVTDSDATLILALRRPLSGGTERTRKFVLQHSKPSKIIELNHANEETVKRVKEWLAENKIKILNVAGPREEGCPGIYQIAKNFLLQIFDC